MLLVGGSKTYDKRMLSWIKNTRDRVVLLHNKIKEKKGYPGIIVCICGILIVAVYILAYA